MDTVQSHMYAEESRFQVVNILPLSANYAYCARPNVDTSKAPIKSSHFLILGLSFGKQSVKWKKTSPYCLTMLHSFTLLCLVTLLSLGVQKNALFIHGVSLLNWGLLRHELILLYNQLEGWENRNPYESLHLHLNIMPCSSCKLNVMRSFVA